MATLLKSPKKAYRALLLRKRSELLASARTEPESLTTSIRTPDAADFARTAADQAVAAATVDLRFRLLKEIDRALNRVRGGTYGVCESCGEEISPNRLDAIPWARNCVTCEENRSKN
jgi:DnaK suppressor protein